MNLPDCEWRGETALDAKSRLRYKCVHPKMAQGRDFVLVHEANCLECTYCQWDATKVSSGYSQAKPKHVTKDVFSARLNICDSCDQRAGNYCCAAGGCGLIHKLRIAKFECPLGKLKD